MTHLLQRRPRPEPPLFKERQLPQNIFNPKASNKKQTRLIFPMPFLSLSSYGIQHSASSSVFFAHFFTHMLERCRSWTQSCGISALGAFLSIVFSNPVPVRINLDSQKSRNSPNTDMARYDGAACHQIGVDKFTDF